MGIVRNTFRLERAKRRIDLIRREVEELCSKSAMTVGVNELRNLALVAGLIVRCALRRKESRGLHYTLDYPALDPSGKARNTIIQNKSAITG